VCTPTGWRRWPKPGQRLCGLRSRRLPSPLASSYRSFLDWASAFNYSPGFAVGGAGVAAAGVLAGLGAPAFGASGAGVGRVAGAADPASDGSIAAAVSSVSAAGAVDSMPARYGPKYLARVGDPLAPNRGGRTLSGPQPPESA